MRYPYDRFIKFLVSRKSPVDATLRQFGLPPVGDIWESQYRSEIRKAAPYSVTQYIDSDEDRLVVTDGFLDWADDEGFRPLWQVQKEFGGDPPPEALDTAFRVFINPTVRSIVGMVLLSKASDNEVVDIIQKRLDIGFDDEVLHYYTVIFWDTDLLGRKGWGPFLDRLKTKEERHYLGLGLASPTVEDLHRYLGMKPALSPDEILTDIMSKAHERFQSSMEQPCPEAAGALKWAELSIKAVNALGTSRKAFASDDDGFDASDFHGMFSVQIEKTQHISLAELQGEVSPHQDNPEAGGDE